MSIRLKDPELDRLAAFSAGWLRCLTRYELQHKIGEAEGMRAMFEDFIVSDTFTAQSLVQRYGGLDVAFAALGVAT